MQIDSFLSWYFFDTFLHPCCLGKTTCPYCMTCTTTVFDGNWSNIKKWMRNINLTVKNTFFFYRKHNRNVFFSILTLDVSCPCVFPADWRGAGFPSEGANRPYQTPAGAPGAGDRQLRHGEHAAGLRKPGHPGPSQGRLQMRSPLLSSFSFPRAQSTLPVLLLDLTWPCRCSLLLTSSLKHTHKKTKQNIKQLHRISCFLGHRRESWWQVLVPPKPT